MCDFSWVDGVRRSESATIPAEFFLARGIKGATDTVTVRLVASDFVSITGSPSLAAFGTTPYQCFLLDPDTDEVIGAPLPLPEGARALVGTRIHYGTTTDPGVTSLRLGAGYKLLSDGESFTSGGWTGLGEILDPAEGPYLLNQFDLAASNVAIASDEIFQAYIYRNADPGSDNYTGDAAFLFVDFTFSVA
jgi:hypothetical protein